MTYDRPIQVVYAVGPLGQFYTLADGSLPWQHNAEDMKRFKVTTMGTAVVMGRRTFESIGSKPLPKRLNIVVSRGTQLWYWPDQNEPTVSSYSLDETLYYAGESGIVSVIGGAEIIKEVLPMADTVIRTTILDAFPAEECHCVDFDLQHFDSKSSKVWFTNNSAYTEVFYKKCT